MSVTTISKDKKKAILIGYEGFVGKNLLHQLSQHQVYDHVKVLGEARTLQQLEHVEYAFMPVSAMVEETYDCDDLFLCYDASFFNLGGKHYISKDNYKYIPKIALKAQRDGVNQIMFLSSKNAVSDSLRFTRRIRGLIEESVRKIDFWAKHIFRPATIIGEETDTNWGGNVADKIGAQIDEYTGGLLKRNRPIEASVIARAMIEVAQQVKKGEYIYRSDWLQDYDKDETNQAIKPRK